MTDHLSSLIWRAPFSRSASGCPSRSSRSGPTAINSGGDGDEDGGRILHLEGNVIRAEETPRGPTLWWVAGADAEHLYAVGDAGRILRRHSGEWRAESSNLDDLSVLYGVWSASPTDVWAVGGSVRRGGPKAVVLRSNGEPAVVTQR